MSGEDETGKAAELGRVLGAGQQRVGHRVGNRAAQPAAHLGVRHVAQLGRPLGRLGLGLGLGLG